MKHISYFIIALLFISSALYASNKVGVISRDASLYAHPFKDAEIVSELPATTAITILKRKGGWYQIKTAEKQGWVRLTRIRLNRKKSANQEGSSGVGEILSGLATGRGKSSQDTTATAVKGLSEEELLNAEPDIDALNALDNFAVDSNADNDSGLTTRQVDYQTPTASTTKAPRSEPSSSYDEDEE